ncbi:hypothetical protein J5N97_002040 [Dioscorea zingiberensis]|uniref:Wall-associated receptor kinase C-terminal domain-containing protein n=1 Tax=Dioscorea zingiberensis TaxID=325984 RepID=A0A9D5BT07_9LILI|nr:hypothetical protein J5N97_002040 [Dioscorea zingiberensis]
MKTEEIYIIIDELTGDFGELMKQGFVLNWTTAKECASCETGGGLCGYNPTKADEFLCFCKYSDGLCEKKGLCSVIGTIAVMCFIFYMATPQQKSIWSIILTSRIIYSKSYSRSDSEKGSAYTGVHVFTYNELEQATNYFDSSKRTWWWRLWQSLLCFGVVLVELISSLPAVDITRHRQEINLSNMAINKIQKHALHELVDPFLGYESVFKVRKMINAVAELAFRCLQNETDMRPSMAVDAENELKRIQSGSLPPSPDSVTINWVSMSSTPNDSTA